MAICSQCKSAVSRKGVRLETLGTVAELVPTSSPFKVGMAGKPKKQGLKPFRILGRLQLSTGEGSWDEWYVAFDDNRFGWLAEEQGRFWIMRPLPVPTNPPAPEFTQIQPSMRLNFGAYGSFVVVDRRQALYSSAEGELPFVATPGAVFMYADLSGADGSLATLDYGDDPGVDAFYVGQQVELADLGIEGLTSWAERKVAARASGLNCPSCGAGLQLKDPAATVRVACTYCGSVLAAPGEGTAAAKFEVLEALQGISFQPTVPLGAEGSLLGRPYVILGAVQKYCVVDEATYFWKEYLLKQTKTEAYHWLVESAGHFSLVEPAPAGKVSTAKRLAVYEGRRYRHFQSTRAVVDHVLGEFYWEIQKGEAVDVADYVAPPRILSAEQYASEVVWSEGVYLPKEELEKGFALPKPLPAPQGVGSNQPWPYEGEASAWWKTAGVLAAVLVCLFVFFNVRADRRVVYQATHDLLGPVPTPPPDPNAPPAPSPTPGAEAAPAPEDRVYISEPFEVVKTGNLEVKLAAQTDNTWVWVGCTLVNERTGEARGFALQSDYYHGVDGGESWSEGARTATTYVSHVGAGTYVLRMEPETDKGKSPPSFTIRLTSGVPRTSRFVVALILILVGPLWLTFSRVRWESRRWAESDYAGSSS